MHGKFVLAGQEDPICSRFKLSLLGLSLGAIFVQTQVPQHLYPFLKSFAASVAGQNLVVVSGAWIHLIGQRVAWARFFLTATLSAVDNHGLRTVVAVFGDDLASGVI